MKALLKNWLKKTLSLDNEREMVNDPIERLGHVFSVDLSTIQNAFSNSIFSFNSSNGAENSATLVDAINAVSFFFLVNQAAKGVLLDKLQEYGFNIKNIEDTQKLNVDGNCLFIKISRSRCDYTLNVLTNHSELIDYLANTVFEISPPWLYFPESEPYGLNFTQGEEEYWFYMHWQPFWSNLSFIEQYDYLKRNFANNAWFDFITEYELSKKIMFYRTHDEYGEFSNFSAYPIELDGKTWPTSEHYFQAQKFTDEQIIENIRTTLNPMTIAQIGRAKHDSFKSNWDSIKDKVMQKALLAKFTQHPSLANLLLGTQGSELIEHTKNDAYWADGGDGRGRNKLGCFLMDLRKKLQDEIDEETQND